MASQREDKIKDEKTPALDEDDIALLKTYVSVSLSSTYSNFASHFALQLFAHLY